VAVSGANNTLDITTRGGFPRANDIIFEEPAAGNQVNLIQGKSIFDPQDFITDRALTPTNQVTATGAPPPIRTVEATKGVFAYTQRLYPAVIQIMGGEVSKIALVRGPDAADYGPSSREIVMSVGDQLRIESTGAPTLQVIPLKVR
jgi:hypothetical protein